MALSPTEAHMCVIWHITHFHYQTAFRNKKTHLLPFTSRLPVAERSLAPHCQSDRTACEVTWNLSLCLFEEASNNGLLASHLRRAIFSFGNVLSLTYVCALKVAWQNTDVLLKRKWLDSTWHQQFHGVVGLGHWSGIQRNIVTSFYQEWQWGQAQISVKSQDKGRMSIVSA